MDFKLRQATNVVLMVRPANFYLNTETAVNNAFQSNVSIENLNHKALNEFDGFVDLLRANEIDVIVHQDTIEPSTPDSIFPNNWVSFHQNNSIVLYPMFAENRRKERGKGIVELIQALFQVNEMIDFSEEELKGRIVEGTGSLIFDHQNGIAYACRSARTDESLAKTILDKLGYQLVVFNANDANGQPIYHTNVMMCVTNEDVIICLESIPEEERDVVLQEIKNSTKEIIPISLEQMNSFAGNMLQLKTKNDENVLIMSLQAYSSLTANQIVRLEKNNRIIHPDLTTIETIGGGSARCMLAEVFLKKREPIQ